MLVVVLLVVGWKVVDAKLRRHGLRNRLQLLFVVDASRKLYRWASYVSPCRYLT